jgi:serine/threonine protein kinase
MANQASDVWAFGVTVYELLTDGGTPYRNMANDDIIAKVRDGFRLVRDNNATKYGFVKSNQTYFLLFSLFFRRKKCAFKDDDLYSDNALYCGRTITIQHKCLKWRMHSDVIAK